MKTSYPSYLGFLILRTSAIIVICQAKSYNGLTRYIPDHFIIVTGHVSHVTLTSHRVIRVISSYCPVFRAVSWYHPDLWLGLIALTIKAFNEC